MRRARGGRHVRGHGNGWTFHASFPQATARRPSALTCGEVGTI
ncbi:hypothetical protein APASM_2580 [Actinosynnema pretiosum subsp. pretiosum]|nr:hypothetical protein APASM_2580 [Actinosynnema pretiosum subsp. pretiosum]